MFQPTINKFEFPLFASIGFATVSCQGMNYFPALSLKAEVGAFYRATEAWSFGLSSNVFMIEGEDRVKEIARMLSGDADTEQSLQHARTLLSKYSNV